MEEWPEWIDVFDDAETFETTQIKPGMRFRQSDESPFWIITREAEEGIENGRHNLWYGRSMLSTTKEDHLICFDLIMTPDRWQIQRLKA